MSAPDAPAWRTIFFVPLVVGVILFSVQITFNQFVSTYPYHAPPVLTETSSSSYESIGNRKRSSSQQQSSSTTTPAAPEGASLDTSPEDAHDDCRNKLPMLRELKAAGVNVTAALCRSLPPWQQVVELYGDGPVVLGLETCSDYRALLSANNKNNHGVAKDPLPKLAGLWNTGSTALSKSFNHNFIGYGFDPEAPIWNPTVTWGKHTPLYLKHTNTWPEDNKEDRDFILPIVLVRDPYRWMNSMVRFDERA